MELSELTTHLIVSLGFAFFKDFRTSGGMFFSFGSVITGSSAFLLAMADFVGVSFCEGVVLDDEAGEEEDSVASFLAKGLPSAGESFFAASFFGSSFFG